MPKESHTATVRFTDPKKEEEMVVELNLGSKKGEVEAIIFTKSYFKNKTHKKVKWAKKEADDVTWAELKAKGTVVDVPQPAGITAGKSGDEFCFYCDGKWICLE